MLITSSTNSTSSLRSFNPITILLKPQFIFLFRGHRELLSPAEAAAWRNLEVERMIDHCDYPAVRELFRTRWLNQTPEVAKLLADGPETFFQKTYERLKGKTQDCPKCDALCRTSRARQCPDCGHTWFIGVNDLEQ